MTSGHSITDNILLSHDLMRSFHLDKGLQKLCPKIDLTKAVESIRWDFVKTALRHLNFPDNIINLIMECITAPVFSVLINGHPAGFFKSSRGLRQGCPLPLPLLHRDGVFLSPT